jgi:hypothetical protein
MVKSRRPRRHERTAPVSLGGYCVEDRLPYPVVHYPNHYGAFFAFSPSEKADFFLCECCRPALENLLYLAEEYPPPRNSNPLRESKLDSFLVPDKVAQVALEHPYDPITHLKFERKLCHRCNLVQPTWRWCHEMYGGQFKQSFGWYIQQAYLRLGIRPLSFEYLIHVCPKEYQNRIDKLKETINECQKDEERSSGLWKEAQRLERKVKNSIENIVRQEFGFRKIGHGWISEVLLYQIVYRLFPDEKVILHYRPDWLGGLELDIFVPRLKLGFEYQGQQHFHPISAWGGKSAFIALQERDERKRNICKMAGVILVEIDYTESLTEIHVRNRLGKLALDPNPSPYGDSRNA